jgi:lysophospholipase L1-like esterase
MATAARVVPAALVALAVALCAACSSGSESSGAAAPPADSAYPSSIVAIGHSGLTGYESDPDTPYGDARDNSWATGTNPEVNSVYLRVLAKNPAVKGHAANFAIDGSGVDSLLDQEKQAAAVTPAPDLVIVQSIDNDIQCDGSDPQNYGPYRRKLTAVLDQLTQDLPNAQIFFVSQWATVKEYDRLLLKVDPSHITGTGPCDPINLETRRLDPQHERYLQHLVDHYWSIITDVCGTYPTCRTDKGLMQTMKLEKGDLVEDENHLSVAGHATMAAMVFDYLYG